MGGRQSLAAAAALVAAAAAVASAAMALQLNEGAAFQLALGRVGGWQDVPGKVDGTEDPWPTLEPVDRVLCGVSGGRLEVLGPAYTKPGGQG